jgi:hypothetical protein
MSKQQIQMYNASSTGRKPIIAILSDMENEVFGKVS